MKPILIRKTENCLFVNYNHATYQLFDDTNISFLINVSPSISSFVLPDYIEYNQRIYSVYIRYTRDLELSYSNLKEINVKYNSNNYISIDGILYQKHNQKYIEMFLYPHAKENEEFIIPKNLRFESIIYNLFNQKQKYLKRVLYRNHWITFDVDENYNKFNYKIKPLN